MVEQLSLNQRVGGSSPPRFTKLPVLFLLSRDSILSPLESVDLDIEFLALQRLDFKSFGISRPRHRVSGSYNHPQGVASAFQRTNSCRPSRSFPCAGSFFPS